MLIFFFSSSSEKNGKEEKKEKLEMVGPLQIVSGILSIININIIIIIIIICDLWNYCISL